MPWQWKSIVKGRGAEVKEKTVVSYVTVYFERMFLWNFSPCTRRTTCPQKLVMDSFSYLQLDDGFLHTVSALSSEMLVEFCSIH